MRSCCVFDSPRLLTFPLLAVYLLSYLLVHLPSLQLLLPRCGGQISLYTSANEDLGTLAEYDPPTDGTRLVVEVQTDIAGEGPRTFQCESVSEHDLVGYKVSRKFLIKSETDFAKRMEGNPHYKMPVVLVIRIEN